MLGSDSAIPYCQEHGAKLRRAHCGQCRREYMRPYQRRRRLRHPAHTLFERARRRARTRSTPFTLTPCQIVMPKTCPALGLRLVLGEKRSPASPSLDRIQPHLGYVVGNVRVICDLANRAKSNLSLARLQERARQAPGEADRALFGRLAAYVERELLLAEVRKKVERPGREGQTWAELAADLDRLFVDGSRTIR